MVVASDSQQSNLTKARIAAEHRSPNRICQVAPIFTPPCNTRFLGPTRVCHQTASRSVQPFCTAHPCVQHTDHVTCDVGSNSPHRTLRAAGDAGEKSAQLDDIWHMINQMHITLWNSKVVLSNISPWAFDAATGQVLGAWNCVHFLPMRNCSSTSSLANFQNN